MWESLGRGREHDGETRSEGGEQEGGHFGTSQVLGLTIFILFASGRGGARERGSRGMHCLLWRYNESSLLNG